MVWLHFSVTLTLKQSNVKYVYKLKYVECHIIFIPKYIINTIL